MSGTEFSIDYILNRAGDKYIGTNSSLGVMQRIQLNRYHPFANVDGHNVDDKLYQHSSVEHQIASTEMFDWLQYTRYHPPRLPRNFRAGSSKRTPGRLPRIPFTPMQLQALENAYKNSNYLSAEDANKLAESLLLTNTRVKIWFQNRRARERRERREKEESCESTSNASSPEPQDLTIDIV